jgi:hypothetical protein
VIHPHHLPVVEQLMRHNRRAVRATRQQAPVAVKRPRGMPRDYSFRHPRENRTVHPVGAENVSEPIMKNNRAPLSSIPQLGCISARLFRH